LESERRTLEELIRRQTTPRNIAKRARIVLMANGDGATNREIADRVGIRKAEVTRWTQRWIDRAAESFEDRLADLPRGGRSDTIGAEQGCRIRALACESPEEDGRPITHWTSGERAAEAIEQGFVRC
jgi:transposase